MQVLIADDDSLVRFSLRSMLEEIDPLLEIDEVEDGESLVTLADRLRPDIAFVDINMPVKDGLSAIGECRRISPNTRYVVLTAYAEFDYARQSISLGVTDYLLKPASPKELAGVLERLKTMIRRQNKKQLMDFQLSVIKAFLHWDKLDHLENGVAFDRDAAYYSFVFFLDAPPGGKAHLEALEALLAKVRVWEEELLESSVLLAMPTPTDRLVRVVVQAPRGRRPGGLAERASHLCLASSSAACMVSCLTRSAGRLSQIYLEDRWLMQNRHIHLLGVPCRATPAPATHGAVPRPAMEMAELLWQLIQCFGKGDRVKYSDTLSLLAARHKRMPPGVALQDIVRLVSACFGRQLNAESTEGFYQSLKRMQDVTTHLASMPLVGRITRIQAYIAEHYMEDLSIASLAEQFGLTPNYLSARFKEKTGKRFVEYLNEVRISNACRLLEADPDAAIGHVAQMTGYTSARYFTRIFKNVTGRYPSGYRNQRAEPPK